MHVHMHKTIFHSGRSSHSLGEPACPFILHELTIVDYLLWKWLTRHIKLHILVFVCLVTKDVHLEVSTDDLTWLYYWGIYCHLRGLCTNIYSYCGSNFIGADSNLHKIIHGTLYSTNSKGNILFFVLHIG